VIQRETPTAKGGTLSVGVIIRLGWQARRHLKANPIAMLMLSLDRPWQSVNLNYRNPARPVARRLPPGKWLTRIDCPNRLKCLTFQQPQVDFH